MIIDEDEVIDPLDVEEDDLDEEDEEEDDDEIL